MNVRSADGTHIRLEAHLCIRVCLPSCFVFSRLLLCLFLSNYALPRGDLGLDLLRCLHSALLYKSNKSLDLPSPVLEPVCRPDTMNGPASRFQNLLPEPITIPRGLTRMVRNAIALDSANKSSRQCL